MAHEHDVRGDESSHEVVLFAALDGDGVGEHNLGLMAPHGEASHDPQIPPLRLELGLASLVLGYSSLSPLLRLRPAPLVTNQ